MLNTVGNNNTSSKFYTDLLHKDNKGYITLVKMKYNEVKRKNDFFPHHYFYNTILDNPIEGVENMFMTLNTFYKPWRKIENVKELSALYLDIDYYNTEYTKEQVLTAIDDKAACDEIPHPSLVIDSGRGLYIIWHIKKLHYTSLPVWKSVQEFLYSQFKQYGADRKCLDCARILRVPGSINSKVNKKVEILQQYNIVHNIFDIQYFYVPKITPEVTTTKTKSKKKKFKKMITKKKRGRPFKEVSRFNESTLFLARLHDLIKLCEMRNYNVKGHREMILFLYRYWLCSFSCDEKKSLEDTLELNQCFKEPLSKSEAASATRSAETAYNDKDKEYRYKNKTLIELLEITPEEQRQLKTIIGAAEKRKRNAEQHKRRYYEKLAKENKLTKAEQIRRRREKMVALKQQGLPRRAILETLQISVGTYENDMKFIKFLSTKV